MVVVVVVLLLLLDAVADVAAGLFPSRCLSRCCCCCHEYVPRVTLHLIN
jgi:hypothetical protein